MINFWLESSAVKEKVFIPKYYNPEIKSDLESLSSTHHLYSITDLVQKEYLSLSTGDEIGKLSYGTGDIPFVRTSDISNWEIKSAPKQGVSEDIYQQYVNSQDLQVGDILLVRDGTYLIGTNCIITDLDKKILYQSHILKIRVGKDFLDPYLFFLSLNSPIFQRQIRSVQFTADTIDTIGNRFQELILPIPKDEDICQVLASSARELMKSREKGKAFIKQAPTIIESVLKNNDLTPINEFFSKPWDEILEGMTHETVTAEFGHFETFWRLSTEIKEKIYLPKYYDPEIDDEIGLLSSTCDCLTISELAERGILELKTGDEIGKMAYGTGDIPFIRTSDFSNWEIKHDPKQGIAEEIYEQYRASQDVKPGDILLVRDGTYLIGSSCMVSEQDQKLLFCGGLYKLRTLNTEFIDEWLLLGLLNSYLVKRQIRTKQFTRDVIDTIGKRLEEIVLPIPKSPEFRKELSEQIQKIVSTRVSARQKIKELSLKINNIEAA